MDKLYYGVAYYDEYMPYERLEEDIKMMQGAQINCVRIGESTWSTLEPQNGVFDFSSIDRVVEAMYQGGIDVIIGTPTYAVPTWLVKLHPEILVTTKSGKAMFGPRQNMDITHPAFLFYAERVIRKLIGHVKDHKGVVGFQIDNETKHYHTASSNVEIGFIKYLKDKFESIEAMNQAFGLAYWSSKINAWEDFPSIHGSINASLNSAFSEYQRSLVTNYLAWQSDLVKSLKRDDQWVTHNLDFEWRDYSYGVQPDVNHFDVSQCLDIVGIDVYHPSQDDLTGCEIAICGDLARSYKKGNYLVLETEAQGFPGWVPYPNQLRLQAFSHLSRGAVMVSYWHWHSIHNSIETYWKGLLDHDFGINPIYLEAKTIGNDFKRLAPFLKGYLPCGKVAIYVDNNAMTAYNEAKMFTKGMDYNDQIRLYYDQLYRLNVTCEFIGKTCDNFQDYQLIILPGAYAIKDSELAKFETYVREGGTLVATLRSGFTDEHVKVRHTVQPGGLSKVCGVLYQQFTESKQTKLEWTIQGMDTMGEASLNYWIELLTPTTGQSIGKYIHPWSSYSGATVNQYGLGKAYYIGCIPDANQIEGFLTYALNECGYLFETEERYPLVVKKGHNQAGQQIQFYLNFSPKEVTSKALLENVTGLLKDQDFKKGEQITLEPWGCDVFLVMPS